MFPVVDQLLKLLRLLGNKFPSNKITIDNWSLFQRTTHPFPCTARVLKLQWRWISETFPSISSSSYRSNHFRIMIILSYTKNKAFPLSLVYQNKMKTNILFLSYFGYNLISLRKTNASENSFCHAASKWLMTFSFLFHLNSPSWQYSEGAYWLNIT